MKTLIKNYATKIKASQTIGEIMQILSQNGARGIATEYDTQGNVTDVFFKINLNNSELSFKIPVKTDKVVQAMEAAGLRRYASPADIAWRICKTWLEAQITLINLEQAKIEEVFLPYMVMPGNKTLYETMKDKNFLLPSGE